MAIVLVTDGEERAALAVVRSLGKAGHTVLVASASGRSLAGASRYSASDHRLPPPLGSRAVFFDALSELVRRHRPDVLIPISEATLRAVLPRRSELVPTRIPFPPAEVFEKVSDKGAVLAAARALAIPEPTIAEVGSRVQLRELALHPGRFPLVLKPTRSVAETPSGAVKTSVSYAEDMVDLTRIADRCGVEVFPILVQRKVEGPGVGVFLLLAGGATVASFGHRRIREKPPSGGVSVLSESIALPPTLVESSASLLHALGWEGVAMVEYKLDLASGEHVLMEINGRFWGSLQLAIDSGVDFPALLVSLALGERPPTQVPYQLGVRTRWVLGDVDHLIARLTKSRAALRLLPSAPGRASAAVGFLRAFFPPVRSEVCRPSDPRPGVRELGSWIRSAVGDR